jgi:large subunit ribosomal protein L10
MKKQDKIFEVQNLAAKIKDAKTVALVDYRGVSANQATELRHKVRETGGEVQVVKNRLFLRALRENSYRQVPKKELEGPTLAVFANQDEITPLKTLLNFTKGAEILRFKIGFMAGRILSGEELRRFAALPGKEQLRAQLVGMLGGQPSRLVYALNYNLQKLALVLDQIKNRKSVSA